MSDQPLSERVPHLDGCPTGVDDRACECNAELRCDIATLEAEVTYVNERMDECTEEAIALKQDVIALSDAEHLRVGPQRDQDKARWFREKREAEAERDDAIYVSKQRHNQAKLNREDRETAEARVQELEAARKESDEIHGRLLDMKAGIIRDLRAAIQEARDELLDADGTVPDYCKPADDTLGRALIPKEEMLTMDEFKTEVREKLDEHFASEEEE